jgi:hypothetical protein
MPMFSIQVRCLAPHHHSDRGKGFVLLPIMLLFAGGVPAHGGEPSPEGRVRLPAVRGLQRQQETSRQS